jgi:hypothetical protein
LGQLLILAGLRRLEETVETEIQEMPVYIDISENKVLGSPHKRGMKAGELRMLRGLIEKRFGQMPGWEEERLAGRSTTELEDLSRAFAERSKHRRSAQITQRSLSRSESSKYSRETRGRVSESHPDSRSCEPMFSLPLRHVSAKIERLFQIG